MLSILLLIQPSLKVDELIYTELDTGDKHSKMYKIETIQDNAVYARKTEADLSELYYLIE